LRARPAGPVAAKGKQARRKKADKSRAASAKKPTNADKSRQKPTL
jgi:hypothetical protein